MFIRTLNVALVALLLAGCPDQSVDQTYAGSARRTYQLGQEAFEDGDYLEAIQLFTTVKNKFAYSKYAALAELRIADAYFAQEKYIEAIDTYRLFVQAHPTHREVPYATWRIGDAYFRQIPSGFFLFPPAYEKDQGPTKDALRALQAYVERFPDDDHVDEARARIRQARGMLCDHELYVARFYLDRDRSVSARGRLETVVAEYADLPERWSEAALLLARVYVDLGLKEEALSVARRLVEAHPGRPEADDARELIAELR